MKKLQNTRNSSSALGGFTLIEMVVAITILSIVMISTISIFIFSTQLSGKIDINRLMQENIKNAIETIAEDMRKSGLVWVSLNKSHSHCSPFSSGNIKGNKFCTGTSEYFLATYDTNIKAWIRSDVSTDCSSFASRCSLVRKTGGDIFPLTNSFISFRDIQFRISGESIPKVTITFYAQPSTWKWVRSELIQENKIFFQTTLSQRLIDLN